jgi:cytochrome c biogenesis protein CcmG, thiol:disulfide interchange protein DsbE
MSRRGTLFSLAALVAVAALIAVEVATSGGSSTPLRPAPQLPTEVLNPPRVSLADLRGRPALVNFWATWCDRCREEAPEMESLARSLHGRATLVGVDWSDDLGNARDFIREHEWSFPVLRDSGEVGDEYGITGLPTTFVLDPRGRIVQTLRGPQTRSSLEAALHSVESESGGGSGS